MEALILIIGFLFLILLRIGIMYGIVPFVLMKVFLFLDVSISFWMCVGICFLVYIFASLFKVTKK
jgi:hypothetical protein